MKTSAFTLTSAACSAVIVAASLFTLAHLHNDYFSGGHGDYLQYSQMALDPLDNTADAPWRYRPLFPLLARAAYELGLSLPVSFLAVSTIAACLSAIAFAHFLAFLGFSQRSSILGSCLYAASCGGFGALRGYGYPDSVTNLIILLTLLQVFRGKAAFTTGLICLGIAAKESLLLVVPLALFLFYDSKKPSRMLPLIALPAATYFLLRLVVPPANGASYLSGENLTMLSDYWSGAMRNGPFRWFLWAIAYSLGPLWFLAAANIKSEWRYILKMTPYILPIAVPLLLTTDSDRVLCLLFPVVIPLALCSTERIKDKCLFWINGSILLLCVFIASTTYYWASAWKDLIFALLCILPLICSSSARGNNSISTVLHKP